MPPAEFEIRAPARARRSPIVLWLLAAVLLGLLWRVLRYCLNLQVHNDDAYLLNNVLHKTYGQLLEPLANSQAAPPGFLWIERLAFELTHSDWGMMLWSLLAGVAALGVMTLLCRRMMRGVGGWLALALFSVSAATSSFSARGKPYTGDLLASVALTYLAVVYLDRPRRAWVVLGIGAAAAAAVWVSFTSIFVAAGIGLTLSLYVLLHRRSLSWQPWAALAGMAALSLGSFGALYLLCIKNAMHSPSAAVLHDFWRDSFPPMARPLPLIKWLWDTHTGRMYGYPLGEKNHACTGQFLLWTLGIWGFWRRGWRWRAGLLLLPQALLLVAAAAGLYPYGGDQRVCMFLAPAMCIFIAQGVVEVAGFFGRVGRRRTLGVAAVGLVVAGIAVMASAIRLRRVLTPEPTIRTLLAQTSAACGERDHLACLGKEAPLEGGGPTKQIFEYYMTMAVRREVRWEGRIDPAELASGSKLFVIVYVPPPGPPETPGTSAPPTSNMWENAEISAALGGSDHATVAEPRKQVAAFETRMGGQLERVEMRRPESMHEQRGDVFVYEYRVRGNKGND